MKTIEISDNLYEEIAAKHTNVAAFMESAGQKALQDASPAGAPRFDAEAVKEGLRRIRANFKGVTLDELMADARLGRH